MTDTPSTQAPDVQPAEAGQGGAGQNGLYDLTAVPEHLREAITPILKDIEGNATKKFQEHADFRKQWEPYEDLGITDVDPEELQELMAFRELASDPDGFRQWWNEVGEQLGFNNEADFQQNAEGDFGSLADDLGMLSRQDVDKLVQDQLQKALAPFQEQMQHQQYEAAVAEELQAIEQELDGLQKQHGEFDREKVLRLASAYGDQKDAVSRGFKDYMDIVSGAQKNLVSDKLNQPNVPETGGVPASNAEAVTDFDKARQMAKERLRHAASM